MLITFPAQAAFEAAQSVISIPNNVDDPEFNQIKLAPKICKFSQMNAKSPFGDAIVAVEDTLTDLPSAQINFIMAYKKDAPIFMKEGDVVLFDRPDAAYILNMEGKGKLVALPTRGVDPARVNISKATRTINAWPTSSIGKLYSWCVREHQRRDQNAGPR